MGTLARTAVEPLRLDLYASKVAAIYRSAAGVEALQSSSDPCARS
jgi:hypothetical protein